MSKETFELGCPWCEEDTDLTVTYWASRDPSEYPEIVEVTGSCPHGQGGVEALSYEQERELAHAAGGREERQAWDRYEEAGAAKYDQWRDA